MSDNNNSASQTAWPLPTFEFRVAIGSEEATFQEVSGLDVESAPTPVRASGPVALPAIKLPGLARTGNVTLKKGAFVRHGAFWDWFGGIKMNTLKRADVTIALVDAGGHPTMVWTLKNAFPVKIIGTDLKAEGNEVGVDSVELTHDGITTENA
ncbi:phage tail protein [Tateyamaria sp. syn59]|uniref:phage tail protein n=1 Tax=Tateyamaria sp. syn59 TaxID=2576942 RepID=UPI0011BD5C1C|nr:phage tail protein [Tateyamaria sp. syn59]